MAGFLDTRAARAVVRGLCASYDTKKFDRYRSFVSALESEGLLLNRTPVRRRWSPSRAERVVFFDWMVRDGDDSVQEIAALSVQVNTRGQNIPGTGEYLFVVHRHAWQRLHQRQNSRDIRMVFAELKPAAIALSTLTPTERLSGERAILITPHGAAPLRYTNLTLDERLHHSVPVLITWLADKRTRPEKLERLHAIEAARARGEVLLRQTVMARR